MEDTTVTVATGSGTTQEKMESKWPIQRGKLLFRSIHWWPTRMCFSVARSSDLSIETRIPKFGVKIPNFYLNTEIIVSHACELCPWTTCLGTSTLTVTNGVPWFQHGGKSPGSWPCVLDPQDPKPCR